MLVVIAKLTVKAGKKAELLALAQNLIIATQAEHGCISYALLDNPYDEASCVFVEEWVDKDALELHFTTPHIREWRQKSAELLAKKSDIKLYEGEEVPL